MDERPKKQRTRKPADENQEARNQDNTSQDLKPRKPRKEQESGGEQLSKRKRDGADFKKKPKLVDPESDRENQKESQSITAQKKRLVSISSHVPSSVPTILPLEEQSTGKPPPKSDTIISKADTAISQGPKHITATLTGFLELNKGSTCLIALLWLPRFFIPWITAWHEFNLYILSNPYHWQARRGDLEKQELYAFACSCSVAMISAVVYELLKKKFDLKYYLFMLLLLLYTLTPVAGGVVDVLLRAGFLDNHLYTEWWFTGVVVMRWLMGSAFAMFPTQFACIYAQNNNMSRNAHYNWTSIFVFLEFLNAYIAFWVIPPKCPTREWVQIVVWVAIGIMLVSLSMVSLIFFFAVPALRYVMLKCIWYCSKEKKNVEIAASPEPDIFLTVPELRLKKLLFCSMILLPVVCSYFTFAVLERFVPDEDWDKHYLWSATSMFYMGRMIGVVLMVILMFCVRRVLKNHQKISLWRAELFYMGVPHVFTILALLTLLGRFSTLSHLNEGDIIRGPIPDNEKTVLLIFNEMFRNRTVCVSSEYFRPVKIRPYSYITRELYDIGVDNFTVNVTVDPCTDLRLQSQFVVNNFTKGDWVVFALAIPPTNLTNEYIWDYYSRIAPVRLLGVEHLRPTGVPQIVIFTLRRRWPIEAFFYQFNHSDFPPIEIPAVNTFDPYTNASIEEFIDPRIPVIFNAPATGTWRPTLVNSRANFTPESLAWYSNATYPRRIQEFEARNFTVNYLIEYYYRESSEYHPPGSLWSIPGYMPDYQFVGFPGGMIMFTVAEVAGPDSDRLPGKQELQQDWAIKVGLTLAGMAAGGLFHGFIYLFWLDPPIPAYRTTTLAVCWVLMGGAAEIPKIKLVDIVKFLVLVLLCLHIIITIVHFYGAFLMYTPDLKSRKRVD